MPPHLKRDLPIIPMMSYTSHKTVRAAEIDRVVSLNDRERQVFLVKADSAADDFEPIILPEDTFARFVPEQGDFLVQYADGYVSFSPRKAFLDGYAPMPALGSNIHGIGPDEAAGPNPYYQPEAQMADAKPAKVTPEDVARMCHEVNRAYCAALGDNSQPAWADAPEWQRQSAITGVHFLAANPDAPPSASHESWLAEKQRDGWRYGEVKDPEAKTHPCFVPYDELPVEQRAKDYLFQGVVRAMLPAA